MSAKNGVLCRVGSNVMNSPLVKKPSREANDGHFVDLTSPTSLASPASPAADVNFVDLTGSQASPAADSPDVIEITDFTLETTGSTTVSIATSTLVSTAVSTAMSTAWSTTMSLGAALPGHKKVSLQIHHSRGKINTYSIQIKDFDAAQLDQVVDKLCPEKVNLL